MEADGRAASPAAQWLAGGMVLFTGALTALGVSGGSLERIMRNKPLEFFGFFLLVVVAIGFGVIAPAVSRSVPDSRLVPGIVGLLFGLSGMGYLAVASAGETQRPQVSASVTDTGNGRLLVAGEARLAGMRSRDYALVRVDAMAPPGDRLAEFHLGPPRKLQIPLKGDPPEGIATDGVMGPYQTVWRDRSGPAPDGTATIPIKVEIPQGRFESVVVSAFHQNSPKRFLDRRRCTTADAGWGCVEIMIPAASAATDAAADPPR